MWQIYVKVKGNKKKGERNSKILTLLNIFVLTDFVMFFDRRSYTESLQKFGISLSKNKPSKNVILFALFFKFEHSVH